MLQKILSLFLICLLALSCKNTNEQKSSNDTVPVASSENTPVVGDNSQNTLDWAGTYNGTTPCADCTGIETSLQLNRNNTYVLATKYLGKGSGETQETKGSFRWDTNGSVITLQGVKDGPTQYKVGEDILVQYDTQGKEITGDLANKYILQKQVQD